MIIPKVCFVVEILYSDRNRLSNPKGRREPDFLPYTVCLFYFSKGGTCMNITLIPVEEKHLETQQAETYDALNAYYSRCDEDSRLLSRHGQVEYRTTMRYIHRYLTPGAKILEIGAGTGRYSLALAEALRLTKPGGILGIAYCMADATVLQYCFQQDENGVYRIHDLLARGLVGENFRLYSTPAELFELVRKEDADRLLAGFVPQAERLHFVGTDMCSRYMKNSIDAMEEETFRLYLDWHDTVCERPDLVGISNHTLDIWRKK
jgi:hypothetical protein